MNKYTVIKNYREDDRIRASFNELAKKTFGIDFEDWYQNGYWTKKYNPYSIMLDGKVVANVSVNLTDFEYQGDRKHLIQLGTVMTDEAYRNRGLIRVIMDEIEKDYNDQIDGMYLFASNSVLDFYPKFGFSTMKQYEYVRNDREAGVQIYTETEFGAGSMVIKLLMNRKAAWDRFEQCIQKGTHMCAFDMVDNSELNMFYITKYMQENVYYHKELDAYLVAEEEDDKLVIDMIIANQEGNTKLRQNNSTLMQMIDSFKCETKVYKEVVLGFTPENTSGFTVRELDQDDRTLFVKGTVFEEFRDAKIMFPLLAHA